MRVDQNKNITSAMAESKVTLKTLREQNSRKQILRDKLQEMHAKLRRMDMDIETKVVENTNLENVQKFEDDLRQGRNQKETTILKLVQDTQKESMAFTGSYVKEYMTQDMKVKTHTDDLKKKMAQR